MSTRPASVCALALLAALVPALPADASSDGQGTSVTIRLVAKTKPGSRWIRDVAPRTIPRGELTEGDTVGATDTLRNAIAQSGKPKGSVVGSASYVWTMTSKTRALADIEVSLPRGALRAEGSFTFGAAKLGLPVVAGSRAFEGARGSFTLTQLRQRGGLVVLRLRLP